MNLISRVLLRRKKMIFVITALGISISALYNEVVTPVYKTSVALLFDLPNLAPGLDAQKSTRDLRNHLEEIRGLARARRIASQIPLSSLSHFKRPPAGLDSLDFYGDQVHRSISAAIIPSTDIIRITVATSNANLGYTIADKAAKFVTHDIQTGSPDSLDLHEILTEQLAIYKKAVEDAKRDLRVFEKKASGITLTNVSHDNLKRVTEADILFDELTFEQKSIQKQLKRATAGKADTLHFDIVELSAGLEASRTAITNSQFALLQGQILGFGESDSRLLETEKALQKARNTFANQVIDLVETRAAQNPDIEINSNLTESINLQIALADIDARKQACEKIKTRYDEGINALSPGEIELTNLIRKKDVNERIYLMLLEKREAARIHMLENRARVRVIDTPRLQRTAASPDKPRNLVLGLVLGLLFGFLLTLVLESTGAGLTSENIRTSAPWPLLSSIPFTQRTLFEAGIAGESNEFPADSIEVEAYRELRTNLKFLNQDDPDVLLVTSLNPQAGNSTITANLAVSYTRLGLKVLMIDAAIRRPTLHSMFAINREPGLTDILTNHQTLVSDLDDEERRQRFYESGTGSPVWSSIQNLKRHKNVSDLVENFQDFSDEAQNNSSGATPPDTQYLNFLRVSLIESIQSTSIKNLKILASGKVLHNFSELVSSRSMSWLLEVTRKKYDIILIDSAPLPRVPDSKVLATLVDGTIIVLDTESQSDELTRVIKSFEKSKIKVAGIVMNKVEPKLLLREKYAI